MNIYYRDITGKMRKAIIDDVDVPSLLIELREQQAWATHISKHLHRAVRLPILAIIK